MRHDRPATSVVNAALSKLLRNRLRVAGSPPRGLHLAAMLGRYFVRVTLPVYLVSSVISMGPGRLFLVSSFHIFILQEGAYLQSTFCLKRRKVHRRVFQINRGRLRIFILHVLVYYFSFSVRLTHTCVCFLFPLFQQGTVRVHSLAKSTLPRQNLGPAVMSVSARGEMGFSTPVSYTHLTLPTIYSV